VQHSPSLKATTSSATHEIRRILSKPIVHHRMHKSPPPVHILSQIDKDYAPPSNLSKIHFNIILPSDAWVLQVVCFLQISPPKPCMNLSSPPSVLHVLHISVLTWPSEWYLVRSTEDQVSCYVVFTVLLPRPSYAQICSQRHQSTLLPQCKRQSFTSIKNNRQDCILYILIFTMENYKK
jgi:hypothetical protein